MTESKSVALPLGYTPRAGYSTNRRKKIGEPTGIRTPDTRLRRPLLYPTELWTHNAQLYLIKNNGADDENRTHAISLEG